MSRPIVYPMQMALKVLQRLPQTPHNIISPLLHLVGPIIAMVILGNVGGISKCYSVRPKVGIIVRGRRLVAMGLKSQDHECDMLWLVLSMLGWCHAIASRVVIYMIVRTSDSCNVHYAHLHCKSQERDPWQPN